MTVELFWFLLGMMFAGFIDSITIVLYKKYKRHSQTKSYNWAKK